jgi:hypothetical protein
MPQGAIQPLTYLLQLAHNGANRSLPPHYFLIMPSP